jgi:Asp-tRNA(Asn)/Glu-tRNA(Gln) amidotransferase C subunit
MQDVFRTDKNEDFGSIGKEAILKNAPEKKDGYIKVKSVL